MIERTTVRLPGSLLGRAKRKAAAEGRTLTALIEEGLRIVVAEPARSARPKRVQPRVSTASGGLVPGIDLDNSSSVQEAEDLDYMARMSQLR